MFAFLAKGDAMILLLGFFLDLKRILRSSVFSRSFFFALLIGLV